MKSNTIIIIVIVVIIGGGALVYFLGFAGEKVTEKKVEKAIEKATNGSVDVDLGDGSVKINTNAGTFEVGEKVTLPSGFPSDVHVVDGTLTAVTTMTEIDGYLVNIETSKSVSQVKSEYESKLKADGWNINLTMDIAEGSTVGAEKDNRIVTVSISKSENKTLVIISTSTTE